MLTPIVINDAGFANKAKVILSPNFDSRPSKSNVNLIVIHNISLPPRIYEGNNIIDLFTNKLNPDDHEYFKSISNLKVSSHFLIRRDGSLFQFVSCLDRAWHAGESSWNQINNCNDFSIGIELEGTDDLPFEAVQYDRLAALTQCLRARYPLTAATGHSDIAPGRKTDPGPFFDWSRFKALAQWPMAPRD